MEELDFEQAMKQIDAIVGRLEKGDVSLDESVKLFEEGTRLIRRCTELLDNAEQKVVLLQAGPDGKPTEQPFTAKDE